MKKTFFYLLVLAFLLSVSVSSAIDCGELETQREINLCAEKEYFKIDKKLNILYSEIQGRIAKKDKAKLKKIQLLWIEYRDAHCGAAVEGYQGGSMEPLIKFECLRFVTEQRMEALEAAYPEELP